MSNDIHEFLREVLDKLQKIDYVKPEELPNIDLYMDQVTTFMDSQLASTKRHEDDKILTKTMINNYAKNNLLPPPAKKKYSKEHILALLFIYYFKSLLSISDIQNILLQILEDGNLTDAQGRKADFSNTIILLTSNLGARCLAGQASPLGFGAAAEETARRGKKALQEAKDYFRPELMGRLDDVVLFDPLGPAQLAAIADRLLCELEERAARQGYTLRHTPAAAAALAGDTVPAYGARELRRKVSRAVEQALADRIAAGTARPGVLFVADAAPDGHITLTMGDVAACAS